MRSSSASSTRWKWPPATDPWEIPVQLAKVLGDVVVTRKDINLTGRTLLVLQPLGADGLPVGRTLVAVDAMGAGVGETVFFVRGKEASFPFYPAEVPVDAGVVGIVDHFDVDPAAMDKGRS